MKKFYVIFLLAILSGSLIAGSPIYNVRIVPKKDVYKVGEAVKIFWDSSLSSQDGEFVRITLWEDFSTQSTCRIDTNVPLSTGSIGYSWTIPGKCTNPHTNQEVDLTKTTNELLVKVRWMGHPDKNQSHYFRIKTLVVNPDVAKRVLQSKKTLSQNVSKLPYISDVRLVESNKKKMLYKVVWNSKNIPQNSRIKAVLLKDSQYYCDLRYNVLAASNNFEVSMAKLCQNKPDPVSVVAPVFQIELALQNMPSVKAKSQFINLPFYPDFKVNDISRGRTRGVKSYFYFYTIKVGNYGRIKGDPVTVQLKVTDLSTGQFTTLSKGSYFVDPGTEIRVVIGIDSHHPLLDARNVRAEVTLDPTNRIEEYNEDNNTLVAEFEELEKK